VTRAWVVPLLGALGLGLYLGGVWFAPPAVTQVRLLERAPVAVLDSMERMRQEVGTLRARIRGVDTVRLVEVRWDTVLVEIPDTLTLAVMVDYRAREVGAVVGAVDSARSALVPGLRRFALPENCDDGLSYGPAGLVCDRRESGHLSPYLGFGAAWTPDGLMPAAEVGLSWRPSWRSRWSVSLFADAAGSGLSVSTMIRRTVR
jgi:hypothetical protein